MQAAREHGDRDVRRLDRRPAGPGTAPGLTVREAEAAIARPWPRVRSRGTPARADDPACPRDAHSGRARWPATARAARRAPVGRRRRGRGLRRRRARRATPGGARSAVFRRARPHREERPDRLRGRVESGTSAPAAWPRGRPGRCRNGTRARARDVVVSQSKAETSRRRALSSAVQLKIGSCASSGSPGKYICVTRRVAKAGPKTEKWMCAGRQAFAWFRHGIRAWPDGHEAVAPLVVGAARGRAREVRVERRVVLVARVEIAAGRVGLPDLHERPASRTAVLVQHAAAHDDPLAQRLPRRAAREVAGAGNAPRPARRRGRSPRRACGPGG